MAESNAQLLARLNALSDQLDKASTEIVNEIQALKDALVNVEVPQEVTDKVDSLLVKAQALDDLNADPPPA